MTDALTSAIETLEWGSRQREQSASLTPAECQAILDELEQRDPAPLTDLLETEE